MSNKRKTNCPVTHAIVVHACACARENTCFRAVLIFFYFRVTPLPRGHSRKKFVSPQGRSYRNVFLHALRSGRGGFPTGFLGEKENKQTIHERPDEVCASDEFRSLWREKCRPKHLQVFVTSSRRVRPFHSILGSSGIQSRPDIRRV